MATHDFPGLTTDSVTGLPALTDAVTRMNGWVWIESIPQLLQGKRVPVEVIFLPPWEEDDDEQAKG